jgi:hypothetical protein
VESDDTQEGRRLKEREKSDPRRQFRKLPPVFVLRREAVPTKTELTDWLVGHLRLVSEPGLEDAIELVDGMLTERGVARIYARAQIECLDAGARPPVTVSLGKYVVTFG